MIKKLSINICTTFRPELDSELLDDRTKVLGVLAADNDGMCLMGKYCNVPEEIFQYYI